MRKLRHRWQQASYESLISLAASLSPLPLGDPDRTPMHADAALARIA
ncbi:hypothetical protein ACVWWJ_003632 [Luteibacter sp. HA06]